MAVRRGLNKSRGLGSLIPQKKENSEPVHDAVPESAGSTNTEPVGTKDPQKQTETKKENSSGKEENKLPAGKEEGKKAAPKKAAAKSAAAKQPVQDPDASVKVRLSQVVPNQDQPRKDFDEGAIAELAESIKQYGVLQPLLVQKKGRYYEIIAGERRWRAAKLAKLKEIPVIIRKFSEKEAMEISLIENIQREDLNAIEEAEAYKKLLEEFRLTQEEVAQRVSRSRTSITNSLRLLKLEQPVREMLISGKISMGHARALLALEDPQHQIQTAELVASRGLSVRETERLIRKLLNPPAVRSKETEDEQVLLAYRTLEENLQKKTGTRVSIKRNGEKGKIEIEYYSMEDLERITDLIG